jgi:sugar (pentulose or hexulose) kinase
MLIGLDLGTTFIKGAVLDADHLRLQHIQRVPFPAPLPGPTRLYWDYDPEAILAAVRRLLAQLLPLANGCEGIVMCSQMHGLVFTGPRGEPRSHFTTWQDQRVLEPHPSGRGTYLDVLLQRLTPDEVRQLGNDVRPGLPIGQCFWLKEQGRLPEKDLVPAALPDFVVANLCGALVTTELTNAMSHGLLNMETLDWHHGVIAKLGLSALCFPAIRDYGEVAGWLPGAVSRVPCYTPVGDAQCALVGALLQEGELSLNISTGSQISLLKPALEFGDFTTRPFFDNRYLATITHIPAGHALSLMVRLFSELATAQGVQLADPWPYISQAAASAGQTHVRANTAFFYSACGDQGEFTHLREEELTVGHFFRAAFQNMADNYLACAQRLSPARAWQSLVFSGGLVQKMEVLRALICDQFQVGYRFSPSAEDTLLGLLALGLAFTHRAGSVAQAAAHLRESYVEPRDDQAAG